MRRIIATAALVAAALLVLSAPLSAGEELTQHDIVITKVVRHAPGPRDFVVHVQCGPVGQAVPFDEDGGTVTVRVQAEDQLCDVTETADGGANETSISGSPCVFTTPDSYVWPATGSTVPAVETCNVRVVNEWDEAPQHSAASSTTVPASPPAAVEAAPVFTG